MRRGARAGLGPAAFEVGGHPRKQAAEVALEAVLVPEHLAEGRPGRVDSVLVDHRLDVGKAPVSSKVSMYGSVSSACRSTSTS